MAESDLDRRLRRALSLPGEPVPSEESLGSVAAALTRRRAHRRMVLGATGVVVLVVFGLTLGLLVGLRSPSLTSATRPPATASGQSPTGETATCVELQIGSGPAGCTGRITSVPENSADQAGPANETNEPAFAATRDTASSAVVATIPGSTVTVTLPRLRSGTWNRVGISAVDLENRHGPAVSALPTHRNAATGATVAVLRHATPGHFVLSATSTASCGTEAPSCGRTVRQWSITLNVREATTKGG